MLTPARFPLETRPKLAAACWRSAPPFVDNERAILIHRPRSVTAFNLHKHMHIGVRYWCGNSIATHKGIRFTDEPTRLLCERCEKRAVLAGLPSAEHIVGRHVHLGTLVAVRTCCGGKEAARDAGVPVC